MITGLNLARILSLSSLIIAITSCSTTKSPATVTGANAPTVIPKTERQTHLSNINSWRINGKIAVQTSKDSGSASVNWVQNRGQYSISLLGPMGSHGLKLNGGPGHVTLQTADGKIYNAASPEQLLAERWGFHLPVSNMRYWVRGMPVPGTPAKTNVDNYGRLTDLVQQGWHVQYQSYTKTANNDLPERISLTSPSLRVKIVIYQWNVG